ncbi:hypothetical protein M758_1G242100 [Ceratodon purpureus]|nr:hypothetical protein M758_1G242100 [Ceratodon purpureus]
MAGVVVQTAGRKLGKTEANWVAAVESGTGTTITSILFDRRVGVGEVEEALGDVVGWHPRLRSVIVREGSEFFFRTAEEVRVSVCEVDRSLERFDDDEEGNAREVWHLVTEEELNTPFPTDFPIPVFVPKLYLLPESKSLLVIRLHASAADMASTATIVKCIVSSLHRRSGGESKIAGDVEGVENRNSAEQGAVLPSVEDAIPPGQANKPFWAHGVDVVGYGLVSRRHAYLPFDDTESLRASKLIRGALTVEATNLLLKECKNHGVSIHGVINAAALKAVAAYKRVGAKGEHYGTTVLLQCRNRLQPTLPESSVGFYHAALMRTIHTSEPEPFWDLAARCSQDFDTAIKNRKHFTDMGDLNALMVQAMRFPNLTPSGSLRTSVLSTMYDPVVEDLGEEAAAVGVKDYLSCSSTHGVGPCLALFPFMRQSALQFSFIYSSPLYSRSLMQKLVDSILFYLSED